MSRPCREPIGYRGRDKRGHELPSSPRRDPRIHARPAEEAETDPRRQSGPFPPLPLSFPEASLFEFDAARGRSRQLLTAEALSKGAEQALSPEEKARRERQRVSVGDFTDFQLSEDGNWILLSLSGKLFVVERASGAFRVLSTGPGTLLDPKFSPDGKSVSYVRDHDLCVLDPASQKERAVITGGTAEKTHGVAESIAREEMDRFTGFRWSPEGKSLAYAEADNSGAEV